MRLASTTRLISIFWSISMLASSAYAGSIEEFKNEFCVYGNGTTTSAHSFAISLTSPSGNFVSCSGTFNITNGDTTTQIVNSIVASIGSDCGLLPRAELGTTIVACPALTPPSVGFTIVALQSDHTLSVDGSLPVAEGSPVTFNPAIFVPEPSVNTLLFAGVLGLLELTRRRMNDRLGAEGITPRPRLG